MDEHDDSSNRRLPLLRRLKEFGYAAQCTQPSAGLGPLLEVALPGIWQLVDEFVAEAVAEIESRPMLETTQAAPVTTHQAYAASLGKSLGVDMRRFTAGPNIPLPLVDDVLAREGDGPLMQHADTPPAEAVAADNPALIIDGADAAKLLHLINNGPLRSGHLPLLGQLLDLADERTSMFPAQMGELIKRALP